MNEVSCRAVGPMFAALDRWRIPRARLVEGLAVTLEHLESARTRLAWSDFVDLCQRLEELVGTEALFVIGASSPDVPSMRPFVALLGRVATPAAVYRLMVEVVGPNLFAPVLFRLDDLGPGRMRATLRIPKGYRDSPAFFGLVRGGLAVNATLCGYPMAEVAMKLAPHRAEYIVTLPDFRPNLLQRAMVWFRGLLRSGAAIAQMEEQRAELAIGYKALRRARRRILRQRALLRQAHARQRVAEEARSAAEAQFHRAQRLEGIGLLAGGIAHDFNNLLTPIVVNTELVLRSGLAPRERRMLETVLLGARRAGELTEQLLAYAGRRPSRTRELDLNELVGGMRELVRTAVPRTTCISQHLEKGQLPITGDPGQIQQVVLNLVTNAVAAVGEGGGTVSIRTSSVAVDLARLARGWLPGERPPGDYVQLEVADTGSGMDAATQSKIFEPFFTTRAEGRGLGLAAVLGIVRGHGGIVEVESSPGAGSRFRVLLPRAVAPPRPAAVAAEDPWVGAGSVLLAEDDPQVAQATTGLLEALGLTVHHARDGRAAVALAHALGDTIDAYLLDRSMPEMSGEQVFRAILARRPGARVVMYSGHLDDDVTRALSAEGLVAALAKPFGVLELAVALKSALGR